MRIAKEALTFDDVLLQPGYSEVLPHEVDLGTFLTRSIRLNIPILSAAMDTVTEARLAIALAQEGGLGIIHKNMPIEQQAREVTQVKKFESGIVRNPITVSPDMTIREVIVSSSTLRKTSVKRDSTTVVSCTVPPPRASEAFPISARMRPNSAPAVPISSDNSSRTEAAGETNSSMGIPSLPIRAAPSPPPQPFTISCRIEMKLTALSEGWPTSFPASR